MELKIISKDDRSILMNILGEDLSVSQIVHHELLEDERVVFAGAVQKHPLLRELVMRIETKTTKPTEVLVSSCLKATEKANDLLSEAKRSLVRIDSKKEE